METFLLKLLNTNPKQIIPYIFKGDLINWQPSLASKSQDPFRGPHSIKEQDDLSNLQRGKLMGESSFYSITLLFGIDFSLL